MYERLEKCPLCKSGHFHNDMIIKDHMVTQESFAITECENCGLKFTNPRPVSEQLSRYYEAEEYVSHTGKSYGFISPVYKTVRSYALKKKLSLVDKHAPTKNRLLDVGCGTGHFLHTAEKNGWNVTGVEINDEARKIAGKDSQATIYSSLFDIPPKTKFEVITMWHVLEHVDKLEDTIVKLKELLLTKGILILALPNHRSWDANHYKEFWAAYDVPRHLYHFNQETVKFLSKEYKFKLKEVYPMVFDSYYVSMLSEKYQNGKTNYLQAVKKGWTSNRKAKENKEYSSLIYVLKK